MAKSDCNPSVEGRFWEKVNTLGTDECWEWQAGRSRQGYGKFKLRGKTEVAHRVAYSLAKGAIPDGMIIRHTCDNPPCNNPKHLLVGSYADNSADMLERNRFKPAKLTEGDVVEIKRLYLEHGIKQTEIAKRYGVRSTAISRVIRGDRWVRLGIPSDQELSDALEKVNAKRRGSGSPLSKLTDAEIRSIRNGYSQGGVKLSELAKRYKVGRSTIGRVVNRETYQNVE